MNLTSSSIFRETGDTIYPTVAESFQLVEDKCRLIKMFNAGILP